MELEHLVVDSGAIIKGHGYSFHSKAKNIWTVKEVLAEIRDSKARALLETLPFELKIRSPSTEALTAVLEFTKKTGDYSALSRTDLYVIALTYTLEKEVSGGKFIRNEPKPRLSELVRGSKSKKGKEENKIKVVDLDPGADFDKCVPCDCSHDVEEHSTKDGEEEDEERENLQEEEEEFEEEAQQTDNETSIASDTEVNQEGALDYSPLPDKIDMMKQPIDVLDNFPTMQVSESNASGDERFLDATEGEEDEGQAGNGVTVNKVHWSVGDNNVESREPDVFSVDDFPSLSLSYSVPVLATATAAGIPAPKPSHSWASVASSTVKSEDSSSRPLHRSVRAIQTPSILPVNFTVGNTTASTTSTVASAGLTSATTGTTSSASATVLPSRILSAGSCGISSAKLAAEDDGLNWITSSNIDSYRSTGADILGPNKISLVSSGPKTVTNQAACVTTDFTMQNILLQMGLGLSSVDGLLIKSVRQWILRCSSCFTVHYDMSKLFCVRCGANTLQRIAASVDSKTGELRLHLRKNYRPNTRGLQYSIPKPGQQGRFNGEILLREDQLKTGIWRQKVVKIQRDVRSAFGDDITGDVGLEVNKSANISIGLGKSSRRGRERRGQKKS